MHGSRHARNSTVPDSTADSATVTILDMIARKERISDAQLRLPDGTHLTLYRDVKTTRHEDNSEIIGDWVVALSPREPRGVGFFYKKAGQQVVEIIYDKHTLKHGERTDLPLPEKMEYVFCSIDDKEEEKKYLSWYAAFAPLLK